MIIENINKSMKFKYFRLIILLLSSCLAFIFFSSTGTPDTAVRSKWVDNMDKYGIIKGYALSESDYPPLGIIFLYIVSKTALIFGFYSPFGLKISLYIFLLFTTFTFYYLTRNIYISILMQIALMLNSVALGYIDIYFAPFLILSFLSLKKKRYIFFVVFYLLSCLIKWQPLILSPILLLYILSIASIKKLLKVNLKSVFINLVIPTLVIFLTILYFFQKAFFLSLVRAATHNVLSANALNFGWVISYLLELLNPKYHGLMKDGYIGIIQMSTLKPITLTLRLIFLGIYVYILFIFSKSKKTFPRFLIYSLLIYLSYFIFNVGVHENHLFIAIIISGILAGFNKKYLPTFLIWSFIANLNLFVFYGIGGHEPSFNRVIWGIDITALLSVINILLFFILFFQIIRKRIRQLSYS